MKTRTVQIGKIAIGGGHKVAVQSMCNTKTEDVAATVAQIEELRAAGCDIVRVAVPNEKAARALCAIKERIGDMPLVADIHFDYKLALTAAAAGVDKIRINPGNIGSESRVKEVAKACRERGIPIRIGVNGGSLEKELLHKYGGATPEAMVESAFSHIRLLQKFDFDDIVVSLKSSTVPTTIAAYRLMSEKCDYPLHLGVTEAGTPRMGRIKSAVGIGSLLCDGIGDTIRVSLTAPPVLEVPAAYDILRVCGLYHEGVDITSCPTCGRCNINLFEIAEQVEDALAGVKKNLKVAIMGCAVNGPGEAREADIGIAGGKGEAVLFKKGEIIRKIPGDRIVVELLEEIAKME